MQVDKRSLRKPLFEGGEAAIYEFNGNLLKVFKPHLNIHLKEQKVTALEKIKFPQNIVAPLESVYDSQGAFIGYSMAAVNNAESFHQLTKNKWCKLMKLSNKELLNILLSFSKILDKIHDNGFIVGDVSDNNILYNGEVYFIDTDSWGVSGLPPDAYTELFTAPEAYLKNGKMEMTAKTDNFAFTVLAFNVLTKLHPFGGTYTKEPSLSTMDRIKRKLAVEGIYRQDITIPSMIGSWKWMSPALLASFGDTFNAEDRSSLSHVFEEESKHLKYCKVCKSWYYDGYTDCPVCTGIAKLKQVIQKQQVTDAMKILIVFENALVDTMLGFDNFIGSDGLIHNRHTKKTIAPVVGLSHWFDSTGKFEFMDDSRRITVKSESNESTLDKQPGSYTDFVGNILYYVDTEGVLTKLQTSSFGNMKKSLMSTFNPLFSASEDGSLCVVSRYPKKAIVSLFGPDGKSSNIGFVYDGAIKEYVLTQDSVTKKWLFAYQLGSGKFRSIIFGPGGVEVDSDLLSFNADTMSNIWFMSNTVYDPASGKIVATNLVKNTSKEFLCSVVDESSKLKFVDGKFLIVSKDKVYSFGN